MKTEIRVVATKVSAIIAKSFNRLARKRGMTPYELLQLVIEALLRYCDDRHNLTPEMEQLMTVFEHLEGWSKAFNLADPTTDPEVAEATYYLADKDHKGVRAVHVEKPFFGRWTQTVNVQQIIERTLLNLTPDLYKRLRSLAVDRGATSILHLLNLLCVELGNDNDVASIRQEFEDASRSEYGRKPNEDIYRRKIHKGVDDMPGLFDKLNKTIKEGQL